MKITDRRQLLKAFAATSGIALLPRALRAAATQPLPEYPFKLGVSSGFPTDHSVILWTRLAPQPAEPAGGMLPMDWPVRYEVARDENFRRIVARGEATAEAQLAHSVHHEVKGLAPARDYWYRFTAGGHVSAIGRTRTLPSAHAKVNELRIVVASCQHYEQAQYAAWHHAATDAPDLVLFLGDYIYETPSKKSHVRSHTGNVPFTLDEYRQRYALYQCDPLLQAAHTAAPWIAVWDDHDVENDYSGTHAGRVENQANFLARRAAAYQAWYEHLPMPPSMRPRDGSARIYARHHLGRLATLHVLDQRQYRSPEPCPQPPLQGGYQVGDDCAERLDPARTMLGAEQEHWFARGLKDHAGRWTLIGQGTPVVHLDEQPGEGHSYWTDSWTGYPAARQRLVNALRESRASNPVILSGDFHAFIVAGINAVPEQLDTPLVVPEFVTTAIASDSLPQVLYDGWLGENPNVSLFDGRHRGYLRVTLSDMRLQADLVTIDDFARPDSGRQISGSWVVEAGSPALHRA